MKNNAKSKNRISSTTSKNELSELVLLIEKIAGRLDALEKKADLVLSRISSGFSGGREPSKPIPSPSFCPPEPSKRPSEAAPAQARPQRPAHERREKVLHKAICADCHRDCEVPFKPTGERPVYCNECFAKRKAGHQSKPHSVIEQTSNPSEVPVAPAPPQRKVIVTKKGVGKVTVSEIVQPSSRESSSKGKNARPAKKSKK